MNRIEKRERAEFRETIRFRIRRNREPWRYCMSGRHDLGVVGFRYDMCAGCSRESALRSNRRRREWKAEIKKVIWLGGSHCHICKGVLYPQEPPSSLLATQKDHEPPLSRAKSLGFDWCYLRPVHRVCNYRKGSRTDSEYKAAMKARGIPA